MNRLAISLLGPFRVTLDGKPVTQFEADTARALLAYLVVHAGTTQRRETLTGLLWPEQPEPVALGNLRQALKRLRSAIGDRDADPPFLHVTRKTIQFNPTSDYWLDVAAFSDAIAASQGHRHRRPEACRSCMRRLAEAVEVYRGDFLAGFSLPSAPFEEWLVVQRERLHRQALEALGHLAAYHERRGEWEQVGGYTRRQVELEPWRESAHRGLMRALALSGERTAALAQYEVCRRTLAEELGVEPEEETTALYQQIRDGAELDALSFIPPRNLPTFLTPFVGREAVLAEIEERLGDPDCRLLTLVGPGGSGKTRLAVEAGAAQVAAFEHGVFFVRLAPLGSVEAIVPTVAQALGFSFYTGEGGARQVEPRRQLLDYVRQKSLLLIMDNFEHLLDGVDLVTDVLKTAPDVSILATSRARLNVQGEQLFPVAGMDFPDEEILEEATQYSAVKLFLTSARRAQPGFELTADNLMDVIRICHLVQGMPLGILLAAAWIQMLSPAEITAQIGQSLDFLETDLRDVPERQRSMRAVFDHSWCTLTEREREVFQDLSVFRGGFTREAAQEVSGASLRELMVLVHKSLLHRTPTGRYELHELLRQYATEKLDQSLAASEMVHDRHSTYYAAALQAWGADLKGPRQQTALVEMETDSENVRSAWNWAVERGQVEWLDQAIDGLCRLYGWPGYNEEGEAACRMAASKLASEKLTATVSGDGLRVWAKILAWQGFFNQRLGWTELASQLLRQSLALLEELESADQEPVLNSSQDTRPERAFVLRQMGHIVFDSDREGAKRLYRQSLALYQTLGDRWGTARVLGDLGWIALRSGVYDEAKQLHEESLAIGQSLGDQGGILRSLGALIVIALYQGRLEESERLARESLAISQETGNRVGIAYRLGGLGEVLLWLGKFAEAHSRIEESVAIFNDLGFRSGLVGSNLELGFTKMHLGRYGQARAQGQMGLTLAREFDNRHGIGLSLLVLGSIALAGEAYAEAQQLLQESVAVYQEIRQQDELAWTFVLLGIVARGLGQFSQARKYLYESLRTAIEIRAFRPLMWALPAMALFLADQGQEERAVELYALASRHPLVANSRWFEDVAGKHIAAVAATLPPDVVAAAQERGRARDLWTTAAELLVELEAILTETRGE